MEQKQVVVSGEQALSQDEGPLQRNIEVFLRRWLEGFLPPYLFKTLFRCLHKMAPQLCTMTPVETIGSQDIPFPDGLGHYTKKQLRVLVCSLLAYVPPRIQWIWEYILVDSIAGKLIPEEIKKMLINPSCQGSQRKQDSLAQEDEPSWVERIQGALPDEDDSEDSTYEPSTSEYESDEYKSQNDTDTELKTGEEDGVIILEELLNPQDELRGHAESQELDLYLSGDESEHPGNTAAPSSTQDQTVDSHAAGMAIQNQESVENHPACDSRDTSFSSDSQDQWVDLSE